MRPRLLLITQWFDPEPTFKGLLFARELAQRGFDVEVVTGFPNYPGGRLYPGYRLRLLQRERIDGVHITRLPLYPSHDHSAIGRALNYLSFAASVLVYGLLGARRPDVIYAYHPPLTTGLAAVAIRLLRRVPLVCDIQDMWPDTLRATGMLRSQALLRLIGILCNLVYRGTDRIVVLSDGFRRLLIDRGVPSGKIDVIHNWADEIAIAAAGDLPADGFPGPGNFRVLFAGNMGRAQALDAVIEAADMLRRRGERVQFIFLGGGLDVARLRAVAASRGADNVIFLPAVPMDRVGAYLREADALLVHLRRDPLFEITIPSKTQAYLAAGRPVIMAVPGDASVLIQASGGGVLAEPEQADSISGAVQHLAGLGAQQLDAMGRRGRAFYGDSLSVRVGVDRFMRCFEELSGRTVSR